MTSADKPVQLGLAKPHTKLAALDRMKQEMFRHEERSNGSGQTFDFSVVEWEPSATAGTAVVRQAGRASCPAPKPRTNLMLGGAESDVSEYGHDSDEEKVTEIDGFHTTEGIFHRMSDDPMQHNVTTAHAPTSRSSSARRGQAGGDDGKVTSSGQKQDIFEFFDESNEAFLFDTDVPSADDAVQNGSQHRKISIPETHPDNGSERRTQFSNLRRPTMMTGPLESSPEPLKVRSMKPTSTRQQRQKSVGSATLVHGTKRIGMKQRRQRSVGVQPINSVEDAVNLAAVNEAEDEMWDDDDLSKGNDRAHLVPIPHGSESSGILGSSMLARIPRVRNPRLVKKQIDSNSKVQLEPKHISDKDKSNDLHEKVEKNKSNRLSLFPKNRVKMHDGAEEIGNDSSKHGGVLGTLLKHAFTLDEAQADDSKEGDGISGPKKANQGAKLNPRNFFGRSKHAFMESDEVSVSQASNGSGESVPSDKEEESMKDDGSHEDDKPMATEASVLALIRAKEKAYEQNRPPTAEEKVLALIRQKEREKAMQDENESFYSDEDEDEEDYGEALESFEAGDDIRKKKSDEDDRSTPSFLEDGESESESPRVSAAESKVLALIKAKQKASTHIDPDLRKELIGEEDEDSPRSSHPPGSTEAKVLALIKAKQQRLTEVDGNLRAELLEEDLSSPNRSKNSVIRGKEKEKELSKHFRSSLGSQSERAAAKDSSSYHHRSSRRSDDGRKTSGSHRATRPGQRRHSPPDGHVEEQFSQNRRSPRSVASDDDLELKGLSDIGRLRSNRDREGTVNDPNAAGSTPSSLDDPEARIQRRARDGMAASCHLPRARSERPLLAGGAAERLRGVDRSLSSTEHGPAAHRPSQGRRGRRTVRAGGSAAAASSGAAVNAALGGGGRRSSDPSGAPPRRTRAGTETKLPLPLVQQQSPLHDSVGLGEPRRRSRGTEGKSASPKALTKPLD